MRSAWLSFLPPLLFLLACSPEPQDAALEEQALLPIGASNEQLAAMREFLGVGRPLLDQ